MSWLLLIVLIKVLLTTESPGLCAGIYAGATAALALVTGAALSPALLGGLFSLIWSFGYFWVLQRLTDTTLPWWSAAIGIPIASSIVVGML